MVIGPVNLTGVDGRMANCCCLPMKKVPRHSASYSA